MVSVALVTTLNLHCFSIYLNIFSGGLLLRKYIYYIQLPDNQSEIHGFYASSMFDIYYEDAYIDHMAYHVCVQKIYHTENISGFSEAFNS